MGQEGGYGLLPDIDGIKKQQTKRFRINRNMKNDASSEKTNTNDSAAPLSRGAAE